MGLGFRAPGLGFEVQALGLRIQVRVFIDSVLKRDC